MERLGLGTLSRWAKRGIRRRLLAGGLVFLALMLLAHTLAGTLYSRAQVKKAQAQLQLEVAARVAYEIEEFVRRKIVRLQDLATAISLADLGDRKGRLLSLLLLRNDAAFTEVTILTAAGKEIRKVSERRVYSPSDLADRSATEMFRRSIRGDVHVGPVYTSDRAEPYVTIAVPIQVGPRQVIGVLSGELNLKFLWQVVGGIKFGKAGYAYVVDGRGNLIAYQDPSLVLSRENLAHLYAVRKFLERGGTGGAVSSGEGPGLKGESVLSSFVPVRGLGWGVILEEPVAVALADVERLERYALLLLVGGLLIGAAAIVWASDKITRPIQELHRGAGIIGAGDLDHRVEIRTGDEIEQLGHQFNKMAGELKGSYAALEERVRQRTRELSALYDLTATVNQSLNLQAILKEGVKKVLEGLDFDACRVYLMDGEANELRLMEHFGFDAQPLTQTQTFQLGEGINGKVAQTGEAFLSDDVDGDSRYGEMALTKMAKRAGFRSFACHPIRVEGKIVGTLNVFSAASRRFSPEIVQLLGSVADHIGVAIDHARLFEEREKRARRLSVLFEITSAVNQSLELEPILQAVVRKITDIFYPDTTRIFLFDRGGENLALRASFETRPEFSVGFTSFKKGEGIVGRVAELGEPLVFENVQTDPRYSLYSQTGAIRDAGFCFLAEFPIRAKENCLGTLVLAGRGARRLAPDDVQLLASVAEQIGVAVEHARLFQEVRAKSQELVTLVEINKDIAALLNREVLLPRIAEEARRILGVDNSIFRLLAGETLILLTASEPVHSFVIQPRLSIREGLSGQVVLRNQVVAVKKLLEEPRLADWQREALQGAGFHSFLGIPMRVANRIIGTLTVFSKTERDFRPDEILVMTAFADQAAIAIQNANLFAEVKQKTAALERANQELVEASQAKSEFMAAMSHELRTPLNVVIGNAGLIRDGFFGDLTPQQRQTLEKIVRHSQMLLRLINDVLAVTRLDANKMSMDVSTCHPEDIVEHVQAYVEQLNYNHHLEVFWKVEEELPAITTDAFKLEEILQNLIGNAFKFTPQGKIEVRLRNLPERERIEFSVADTGIGIEQEALGKIFDQFYQHKDAHTGRYSGVGLGLTIVKQYLEMMQGEIRVESQPRKGSTFIFTLPYSI